MVSCAYLRKHLDGVCNLDDSFESEGKMMQLALKITDNIALVQSELDEYDSPEAYLRAKGLDPDALVASGIKVIDKFRERTK